MQYIADAVRITPNDKAHFFGYYDKSPWNLSGTCMLSMEVGFDDRPPLPGDTAIICVVDLHNANKVSRLCHTTAWNFQQGAMLQWLPSSPDRHIIYNDRQGDTFVSILLDIISGERRTLPKPITAVSHDGRFALSLNYSRLHQLNPGYGYGGVHDPWEKESAPDDDGIYLMNLSTGEIQLIISLSQISIFGTGIGEARGMHWFNHLAFNPKDYRFSFLHRFQLKDKNTYTRLLTSDVNGKDIHCLEDSGYISHYDWRNSREILAWARRRNNINYSKQQQLVGLTQKRFLQNPISKWILRLARRHVIGWVRQHIVGDRFILFTDQSELKEDIGVNVLTEDGHCSYSPDRRWILMDTYPHENHQRVLLLYDNKEKTRIELGRYYSPPELNGDIRCDLHARWNREGTEVCIDSAHEGTRQMYVLDVTRIVHYPNN